MNLLNHKGYKATVAFDADDEIFVGHLIGINDIVGFHADNVADLKAAFVEAVEDYLETCERVGKAPERSFSGNLMLRIEPTVHAAAATAAEATGKSLNQWSEDVLREAAERTLA
ncbi:type II toxin-antitoxin system HicB family antitoxin [Salinarimonas sp.]|uniref:type II toxin-antitoxin system HicB family antitoxin n=1 Tax=Salinarimonas sp. TaxID=2766526 RepID=UPI0032D977EF